ncbi:MAG: M56 family metallopeptidase, partial [Clostridia bacterium]|nr:M56 family metallopeptidase [Clostridia bacterium]
MRTALVYNFLIEANIMASIAICLMAILRRFFRRQVGNRSIRFGWLLVAIRLLVPVSLPNPWIWTIRTPMQPDPAIRPIAGQVQIRFRDAVSDLYWNAYTSPRLRALEKPLRALDRTTDNGVLSMQLMQIYLVGVIAVLIWFLVANLRFRHTLRSARIEPISGTLAEEYAELCRARGIRPVPVYFTDPLPSACLVGVFRPYIALPLTARPGEAIQVLTHEVCHLKGHDGLWSLVRLVCVAIHWFNPLVWAAAFMSRTDNELACDDRVVSGMDREARRAYAGVLVLAASRHASPGILTMATGMTMTGRTLKARVASVMRSSQVKKGLAIGFCALAAVCLVLAMMTGDATTMPSFSRAAGRFIPTTADAKDFNLSDENFASLLSDAEACNRYFTDFWGSDFLQETAEGGFSVSRDEESDMAMVWVEDGNGLIAGFNEQGQLLVLRNERVSVTETYVDPEQTIWKDEEVTELYSYLNHFLPRYAGEIGYVGSFYNMGEHRSGADRFVDFYFRYADAAGTEGGRMGYITLQLLPTSRVVRFSDTPW